MKAPTPASLKKVTPENLERLGASRLAAILVDWADGRAELKRRLRMELAADQGAEALMAEIDKRLDALADSRSRVSWRQRSRFVKDLAVLLDLIAHRLGDLALAPSTERLWRFLAAGRRVALRVKDRDGALDAVFRQAAQRLAGRLAPADSGELAAAFAENPAGWSSWLEGLAATAPPAVLAETNRILQSVPPSLAGLVELKRRLADQVGDAQGFAATFTALALKSPAVAAEVALRLLDAGQVEDAGDLLDRTRPRASGLRSLKAAPRTEEAWEAAYIVFLDRSGRMEEAQERRWAAFERTLSVEIAKAFCKRLPDFEDVEAEHRAFDFASGHDDADAGLRLLMTWPALPEAAAMITARSDRMTPDPDEATTWAGQLAARFPEAAERLLRRAAVTAFQRRELATSARLNQEADSVAASS